MLYSFSIRIPKDSCQIAKLGLRGRDFLRNATGRKLAAHAGDFLKQAAQTVLSCYLLHSS